MATVMDMPDIPVATVEAARRRDEVLPEHERQYPADDIVRAMVEERYDGSSSTNKAIGNELYSHVAQATYPSWRIEQIAQELRLTTRGRAEMSQRVRRELNAEKRDVSWRQPTPTQSDVNKHRPNEVHSMADAADAQARVAADNGSPLRAMVREDLAAIAENAAGEVATQTAICQTCGQTFEPWKAGRGLTHRLCRSCFRKGSRRCSDGGHQVRSATPTPTQDPTPEPVPAPQLIPVFPARFPDLKRPDGMVSQAPSLAHLVDEPEELTFGDLPGSGAVFELLDLLPTNGRWTGSRRLRWFRALEATLNLLIDEEPDTHPNAKGTGR